MWELCCMFKTGFLPVQSILLNRHGLMYVMWVWCYSFTLKVFFSVVCKKLILDILPKKYFQKLVGVGGANVLIVVDLIQLNIGFRTLCRVHRNAGLCNYGVQIQVWLFVNRRIRFLARNVTFKLSNLNAGLGVLILMCICGAFKTPCLMVICITSHISLNNAAV